MAEGEGFEPSVSCPTPVFKTGSINHSVTLPIARNYNIYLIAVPHTVCANMYFMRETQRKGDIAVTQAIATFTKIGYDISLPVTKSAAYDIVVDDGMGVFRVQVRYWGGKEVELRRIHSNSTGYVIKKTKSVTYDWLYVLKEDGTEYLIKECFQGRRSVRPQTQNLLSV